MTKNAAQKKASRARATAERSTYVRGQRLEREATRQTKQLRPGGDLRAPIAEKLVWARVLRPSVPLVYLDLNHYINLARASPSSSRASDAASKPGKVLPGYADLAMAARDAKVDGRAMFPLSGIHLMEVSRIRDPRQRADVAAVMEDLSGFNYLLNRSTLTQLEMDAGLDHLHGVMKPFEEYLPLVGASFAYGFGRNVTLTMKGADGRDTSAEVRHRMGENRFAEMVTTMNLELERKILRGPTDDEIPELRARGWNPEFLRQGQESRLGFELETQQTLADSPEWRTGRLRDVISGRDVYHEWLDIFLKHLTDRREQGVAHSLPSEAEMAGFWAAMPQVQVAISMKARYHRNTARTWTMNDISDIDAMSIAYPYCEAVFTDREARAALADTRDLRRFGTYLPKRPEELTAWLEDLPSIADSAALVPHPLYGS